MNKYSEAEYIKKYTKNKEIIESGIMSEHKDWEVTICFYAALHIIESKLVIKGCSGMEHKVRNEIIRRSPEFRSIAGDYTKLYLASIRSRYHCDPISTTEVNKAKGFLEKIEEII